MVKATITGNVSLTQYLGNFLKDLAQGDGKPWSGQGVSGVGRIIDNVAFRREVGI